MRHIIQARQKVPKGGEAEKMSQREQINQIKTSLMKLPQFRSRCAMCHTKKSKSGFIFHHRNYIQDEKTYSDFPNGLAYHQYLEPLIRADPKRFRLLCSDHHQALERALRYGPSLWRRLNWLRRDTLKARAEDRTKPKTIIHKIT